MGQYHTLLKDMNRHKVHGTIPYIAVRYEQAQSTWNNTIHYCKILTSIEYLVQYTTLPYDTDKHKVLEAIQYIAERY